MTLLVLELVENSRVPVDDPTTHLELTMIHEVMVLDHSGPDFACIQYAAALKLWLLGSLLVGLVVPVRGEWWLCLPAMLLGMAVLGAVDRHDRVGNGQIPAPESAAVHRRRRDLVRRRLHRDPGMTPTLSLLNTIQAIGLLSCFALLGTSRIGACIRWLSLQGIVFGLVPLILHDDGLGLRAVLLSAGNIALKGVVFPWLLLGIRARAEFSREVDPFVGYIASILFGILALGLSVWLGLEMKPALARAPFVMLVSSIFLILVGLFLIISRKKALMQVIGYLVLENGIFLFGVITVVRTPLLVELGVLLDAFVGVFVMGIAIFHINREFGSMDIDRLTALRG